MLARLAPVVVLAALPAQVGLLANLNTEPRSGHVASGAFDSLTRVGRHFLFAGSERTTGQELWVTAGKPSTTRLLADINPADSSRPRSLIADGARAWFVASDGEHGTELWVTDGTAAGTRLASDITPGFNWTIALLTPFAGGLAFAANNGQIGTELWFSNGTVAGTRLVRDIQPGPAGQIAEMTVMGGALWLSATDGVAGYELWRSDGTPAGTRMFLDLWPGSGDANPHDFAIDASSARLLFTAATPTAGRELWITDGTAAGTRMVADLASGNRDTVVVGRPVFAGGTWFVVLSVAGGANTLWRTDGTAAGTVALALPARPQKLWPIGRRVLCGAHQAPGPAVFISDGTTAGTLRLADAEIDVAAVAPGGVWFGSAYSSELWFSDLTPRGTRKLGAEFAVSSLAVSDAGDVVATADETLWQVTRSGEATLLHAAPRRIDAGAEPRDMVTAGTFVLGSAEVGGRTRIFRTDGTDRGTWLTAANLGPRAQPVGVALGRVLLSDSIGGASRLYAHDGGTGPALDLLPPLASLATRPVGRHGTALFVATDPAHGDEPWLTDGTPQGTRLLLDITPGPNGTSRRAPIVIDAQRFALPTADDRSLYWSDGTNAGTRRLAMPAATLSPTFAACRTSGRLLLASRGEVWACDGQSFTRLAPNVSSSYLFEHAGSAWFVDHLTATLWQSDGSPAGTAPVLTLPSRNHGQFTSWRGGLVFGDGGFSLWWTDGTAAGTRVLASLSSVHEATAWSDDILVVRQLPIETQALGSRLWLIRGDGTLQFVSTHTGRFSGMYAPTSGRLVFAHDDGPRGTELWSFDPGAAATEVKSGCGHNALLNASPPRLGTRMAVRGETTAGTLAFAGALWLGQPLRPMPHAAGCALAGDLTVLADAFPVAGPQFARSLTIPPLGSLLGTELALQAMLALPHGLELSHGVHLRVGR